MQAFTLPGTARISEGEGLSDEIRYGVIGTGMMGVEHIENIAALEGASVAAIADPDPASRETGLAAVGHDCAVYPDHASLLADETIDAVVVVSPNHTHIDVMRDVLATGKHVLCEKPLCTTTADCRELLELAEGYPSVVWVGLEYRYMPAVEALIQGVRDGLVGDVQMVAIREHRFPFLAKVGNWNRFSRNTGGTLVEKCCHFFDLMNLITGQRPRRVYASGGQNVNHLDEVYDGERPDILDNAYVIVDYDRGVRAMLDLCMFAEATLDQEELTVVGDRGKLDARLPSSVLHVGRRGRHDVGDHELSPVETRHVTNPDIAHQGLHHGSSYLEHVGFVEAIRNGTPPEVTLEDGLWSVAVGEAAHRSIAENRPVDLDEL